MAAFNDASADEGGNKAWWEVEADTFHLNLRTKFQFLVESFR